MEPIKDIVRGVIQKLSGGSTPVQLQELWKSIVGDKGTAHTRILSFEQGKVVVEVDSPAWLYQMSLKKRKILQQLQQHISDVKNISFKIGNIH